MILYRVPPEAKEETTLFSVMGENNKIGELCEELFLEPGPIFHLPINAVLLSSRICSGSLKKRLLEAKAECGTALWFLVDPMRHLFPLPCRDGVGQLISDEESLLLRKKHQVYDSPEFICQYCVIADHEKISIHLFDTAQSIQEKIHLAQSLDIENIIFFM